MERRDSLAAGTSSAPVEVETPKIRQRSMLEELMSVLATATAAAAVAVLSRSQQTTDRRYRARPATSVAAAEETWRVHLQRPAAALE